MNTNNQLKINSELIENYFQSEAISPQKKFRALQTKQSLSLLFSIGSDHVFYLFEQQDGNRNPWKQEDLSSHLSTLHGGRDIAAKTFSVAQDANTGNISIALVITDQEEDFLYVSEGLSNMKESIDHAKIQWSAIPYDDQSRPTNSIQIRETFIGSGENEMNLIVDLVQPDNFLARYYIYPNKPQGQRWEYHAIGGQLNTVDQSCTGHRANDSAGIYNLGSLNGKQALFYMPFKAIFGGAPQETVFVCPPNATAISTTIPDHTTGETALFVAAGKALHYFATDKQTNGATGINVVENDLFQDVVTLFAHSNSSDFVVWGINRDNTIFYTSCPKNDVLNTASWSCPIPILSKVEHVSPYINHDNNANVFFAVSGNTVKKAVQSPTNTIWDVQEMTLPNQVQNPAEKMTYMSMVKLETEDGIPLVETVLNISASTRGAFYINNLYYILDKTPIPIKTDYRGSITIVEEISSLSGAEITVSEVEGKTAVIKPTTKVLTKITELDSLDKLRQAQIKNLDGTTRNLVSDNVSDDDLSKAASALKNLNQAYQEVQTNTFTSIRSEGVLGDIKIEAGNLFSWLSTGVEHTIKIAQDEATRVWHAVVEIAGKIYEAVLDGIEKIMDAARWIFNAIKTTLKDLLDYLKHLFDWKEIWNTHEVLAKMANNGIAFISNTFTTGLNEFKSHADNAIAGVKHKFSGLNLPEAIKDKTLGSSVKTSAPGLGDLMENPAFHWVIHNIRQCPVSIAAGDEYAQSENPLAALIDTDFTPMLKETVFPKLHELFKNKDELLAKFANPNLSLQDLFDLLKVLGETALTLMDKIVDIIFSAAQEMVNFIKDALSKVLEIPFLSKLYETLSGLFGHSEKLTVINGITFLMAIPATAIYTLAKGEAPFKNGARGLDDPDLFSQLLNFGGATTMAQSDLAGSDDLKSIYNDICHPIGRIALILRDALAGCITTSNTNVVFNVFPATAFLIGKLLTINIPDGVRPMVYVPKWICDALFNLLLGIPLGFIPQPGGGVAGFIIKLVNIPFYLITDIELIAKKGVDKFSSWAPILLDGSRICGNVVGNTGLAINGTGQDSIAAGGVLAWLIPIALPIAGVGFGVAAISDLGYFIADIVEE